MLKITTYYEQDKRVTSSENLEVLKDNGGGENAVNVYPEATYQRLYGFGGAITEAAGYVYSQMTSENKKKFIDAYYGKDGLGYNFGRCSIDSCDFGLGNYCSRESEDSPLDLTRDKKYIIPLLNDIYKEKAIPLLMAPWSPPAFMKTTGERNNGGKLKQEYYGAWAKHISEYLLAYKAMGFDIFSVNTQNEPHAVQTWDSCVYRVDDERIFLEDYLYPELISHGLSDVKRIIWDHNRDGAYERVRDIIAKLKDKSIVDGVGYHWYSGDHFGSLKLIGEKYPDLLSIFTEGCIEYSCIDKNDIFGHAARYAHEIIGCFNNGCNLFIDWNILLDSKGGPNHVGNYCAAPIMADDEFNPICNPSYYIIGHFSKYLQNGAVRMATVSFSKDVEATAWKNMDGSMVIVIFNSAPKDTLVTVRVEDKKVPFMCKGKSINTIIV